MPHALHTDVHNYLIVNEMYQKAVALHTQKLSRILVNILNLNMNFFLLMIEIYILHIMQK